MSFNFNENVCIPGAYHTGMLTLRMSQPNYSDKKSSAKNIVPDQTPPRGAV